MKAVEFQLNHWVQIFILSLAFFLWANLVENHSTCLYQLQFGCIHKRLISFCATKLAISPRGGENPHRGYAPPPPGPAGAASGTYVLKFGSHIATESPSRCRRWLPRSRVTTDRDWGDWFQSFSPPWPRLITPLVIIAVSRLARTLTPRLDWSEMTSPR
jgi:hypothetical protein